MAKTIQISTVKHLADVEVIYVNARLISKAILSSVAIHRILDKSTVVSPVFETDDEGQPVKDEKTGMNVITGEKKSYEIYNVDSNDIKDLDETVASFIDELCKAFEE